MYPIGHLDTIRDSVRFCHDSFRLVRKEPLLVEYEYSTESDDGGKYLNYLYGYIIRYEKRQGTSPAAGVAMKSIVHVFYSRTSNYPMRKDLDYRGFTAELKGCSPCHQ